MKNFESQSCKRVASLVLQKGLQWVLHGPAKGLPDCLCFTAPWKKQQHVAPHSGNCENLFNLFRFPRSKPIRSC